jgi:hypothetical protein
MISFEALYTLYTFRYLFFVQLYVSAETKHVLSIPSNARTEQQIAKV